MDQGTRSGLAQDEKKGKEPSKGKTVVKSGLTALQPSLRKPLPTGTLVVLRELESHFLSTLVSINLNAPFWMQGDTERKNSILSKVTHVTFTDTQL